jgi:hypothetical protein
MNRSARYLVLGTLLACCVLAACASAASSRSSGAKSTRLTQEELATTNSGNLYDAISKLRPEWLTSRGPTSATDPTPTTVHVFVNGTLLGDVDYLRQVQWTDVNGIRYWDAGQASARFGMGHPRGVIELLRK